MQLKRWRSVIGLLTVIIVAVSASALGKENIIYGFKGAAGEREVAQQIIHDFNASRSDIEVELLDMTAGGSWVEKLAVLFAGGTPPDVVRMEYQRSIGYILDGMVRPLDPFIESDPTFRLRDFFPVAIQAHTVNGKVYGIPQEAQPFTMFVNTTLLGEHGFATPGLKWTVDDLVSIARKITRDIDQDGVVDIYGWQFDSSITRFEPFLMAFGTRMLSADGSKSMLNSPEVLEAMQFYYEAAVQYGVKGGNFAQGTAAFYSLGGPWMVPGFRKSITGWDWDILPMPGGPGGRGTTLGSDANYISTASENPEAAWEFVKYLTSADGLSMFTREGNIIASRSQVAVNYIGRKATEPPYNLQAYLTGIEISRPTQVFKRFIEADNLFGKIMGQLWGNQISLPAALDTLATQINAML